MSVLVVDTNVVAYVMKGHPLALAYRPHLEGRTLAVSFMTVAELYEGAYRAGWGRTRLARLETTLRTYLIVPSSPVICRHWAMIRFERRTQPISVDDAWVAATARAYGCPLVTYNAGDFDGVGHLRVITEHQ